MPRRIEVELTSRRDDGTWTWRAAGAREPKGAVDGGLLPPQASVGMVLKAEIEIDIDGIVVTAITPPKTARAEPQRLEIIGGRRSGDEQLVTTSLVRRGRDDRRPRRDRGEGGERGDRDRGRGERGRGERGRADGDRRPEGDGARRPRPEGGDRRRPPFERKAPLEPKPKAKRLRAGRTHRSAVIAALPAEQQPIAEELVRGGLPAVRAALDKQNETARAEGRPEIDPAPLVLLAEQLWPQVRSAEWRDRAEGALADVDELDLRDLRSVVVAADGAARDDESRALAGTLRDALNRRVDEEHAKWLVELAELVADGRVVAALRRSSRPPKAGAPLPAELAATLAGQAGEALNPEATADRWAVVLDALSYSPVRTSVVPAGVPEDKPEELLAAVRKAAPRLPAVAALFGIEATPVPAAGRSRRGGRPEGRPAATPRIPPPPALPGAAAPEDTAAESVVESVDVHRPEDAVAAADLSDPTGIVAPPEAHHEAQPHDDTPAEDVSVVESVDVEGQAAADAQG